MTRPTAKAAIATLLALAAPALAQLDQTSGCLYLTGSSLCPGFEGSYVAVENQTAAYPFFSRVYDMQDFDRLGLQYINSVGSTKLDDIMGCNNADSTVIRYERTVLCGVWTSSPGSLACIQYYQGPTAVLPKQVCATTCDQNRQSMQDIASNSTLCGRDRTGGARDNEIANDYAACTAGASTNTATCVSGDMNEHNCGFASSSSQVCTFCSTTPEKCCTEPSFDISGLCGLDATALSSSAAANTATASADASRPSTASKGLSGGAIAGIVVGVVGGIALIAFLAFCFWRRKRNNTKANGRLLASPEEKNHGTGWGKSTPDTPAQNSPEIRGGTISEGPIERSHTNTTLPAGAAAATGAGALAATNVGHAAHTGVPAATNFSSAPPPSGAPATGNVASHPSVAGYSLGVGARDNEPHAIGTPGVGSVGHVSGTHATGSSHGHGGALAGAAAAGAAAAGVGALAANKQRRDAPSPPTKRNFSPPAPTNAPHQSLPQAQPSITPTADAFPHVPSSPPRPLPAPPTNTSPRSPQSAYTHTPTSPPQTSPPRGPSSISAPKAALAAAPLIGAASQPAPAVPASSSAANMAGVGAGASAAAAASAAAGADTTRLPRLELPKGSGVWIEEGSRVVAQHPYNAALVDELSLVPGMLLIVHEIYDDGWARGVVDAGGDPNQVGRIGQFPTVCVAKA
ncbi:hypothetical protein CC85DRAFT_327992 [Cutaneotrichosporon oleaginosum]|uniref:SH3 domain-containing protein n=1 Tax=Cutaneotrichosporon oleaginosum TaxID=879819 RepID=A0A0J0XNQ6_9TREE|nr:uncharacterized protein CC85DRAFT_327992 [Cutaneotrichosporon oleaginosum]KLT42766.1 hypothetical protein CC85DRAFT_327992 [Cutaneotrichosporon oleaginosum]TXT09516.1 hypothetical protein COLE_03450 [Cutaneotrichosporon oleaginosum]